MKRILITGASGMIGRSIVRVALKQGYEITCLVRKNSCKINIFPEDSMLHIIACDMRGYEKLRLDKTYNIFMHLAWALDKNTISDRDNVNCQMDNIRYTLDAVRLAKRCGCSVFIGAGSQAEYGVKNEPLACNTPVNPESGYGIAKYCAGKMASLLCGQSGMRFNCLRILSVYGPGDNKNSLISYTVRELKAGRSPELTKCEQTWDYIHCDDVARAFLAVAEHGVDGKYYPIGSGIARSLSEYVNDIKKIIAPDVPVLFGKKDYYPHQPMCLVADITELRNDTKFIPIIDFRNGIKSII